MRENFTTSHYYLLKNDISYQLIRNCALGVPDFMSSNIEGINEQAKRHANAGGYRQQERMIKDKRRALDRALQASYQSAWVKQWSHNENAEGKKYTYHQALINPNKLKQDYDEKNISIGYEYGFEVGDIFHWEETNTYWLIYLQDLTELAYFRGQARRCRHLIKWKDSNGNLQSTYAAVVGPKETRIQTTTKGGVNYDTPNYSLSIYIPNNEYTQQYFKRYAEFYLQEDKTTCWQVQSVDTISMPNIIEVIALEHYANKDKDDLQQGIVDGLIGDETKVNITNPIKGEGLICKDSEYIYTIDKSISGQWTYDKRLPIECIDIDDHTIKLVWRAAYGGKFEITFGDYKRTIVVESLF